MKFKVGDRVIAVGQDLKGWEGIKGTVTGVKLGSVFDYWVLFDDAMNEHDFLPVDEHEIEGTE